MVTKFNLTTIAEIYFEVVYNLTSSLNKLQNILVGCSRQIIKPHLLPSIMMWQQLLSNCLPISKTYLYFHAYIFWLQSWPSSLYIFCVQGLVISLPYCFLNTEVQNVVKSHWKRWLLIQTVGRGQISARTSITASTTYSIHNKEILQVRLQGKGIIAVRDEIILV